MNLRIACFLACLGSAALPGQDVVTVAPAGQVKVEHENDQVRVLRFTEPAGAKLPMHSHPPYVIVGLTNDVTQYSFPDGKTSVRKNKAGQAEFSKAITHAAVNTGKTTAESIMVELKTNPAGITLTGAGDMVKTNPKMCKVETDNEYARITRVKVPPYGKLAMHSHPSPNFVVYLTGLRTKTISADGKEEDMTIEPGTVRVNSPSKHSNENLGDKPSEVVVIELKTAPR